MRPVPWAALLLLLATGALYAVGAVLGGNWLALPPESLVRIGALRLPLASSLDLVRLFSSPLVHVDLLHVGTNGALLLLGGVLVERQRGPGTLLGLFLAGGVGGGLAVLLHHGREPMVVGGASGALCALLVAAAASPGRLRHRPVGIAAAAWLLAVGLVRPEPTAGAAHLGGALLGLLLRGWGARPGRAIK